MKKILVLLAAVGMAAVADAQFMLGLQGGFYSQKKSYSFVGDYTKHSDLVGGIQVGGQIKKVYLGAFFNYEQANDERFTQNATAQYNGTVIDITDSMHTISRIGVGGGGIVRVQLLSYGNMQFHLMLQGSAMFYPFAQHKESYVTGTNQTVLPQGEYTEPVEPYVDSVSTLMFGVSIRPTITYEFSEHFSAELTLDLLSIGYAGRLDIDARDFFGDGQRTSTTSTLYAGFNSFHDALKWETPLLRLGFHYKF